KANSVRLDIGTLAHELQGAAGIVGTVACHGEGMAARADFIDATGRKAIHEQRDVAMVPEVLGPEAGICRDCPATRQQTAAAMQHHDGWKRPRPLRAIEIA